MLFSAAEPSHHGRRRCPVPATVMQARLTLCRRTAHYLAPMHFQTHFQTHAPNQSDNISGSGCESSSGNQRNQAACGREA